MSRVAFRLPAECISDSSHRSLHLHLLSHDCTSSFYYQVWGHDALVHMIELYLNPDQDGVWEVHSCSDVRALTFDFTAIDVDAS